MDSLHPLSNECYNTYHRFKVNLTYTERYTYFYSLCEEIYYLEDDANYDAKYSKPMVWIGIYIAIASLFCILAMAADLVHGFRNRKMWFPCKYFSLNAASITVVTIAMKLPIDMNSPMPGYMDQAAKLGSLVFMCTMIANFMPSLASMDNKTLVANFIGLAILVITVIVNIFIEINTGLILDYAANYLHFIVCTFKMMTCIYIAMILLFLIILTSSAIAIPTCKEILESKYQATSKSVLNDQHIGMSMVEKLRECVRRYWVMAETGNPQFVMASNPLSTACGVICVICLVTYVPLVLPIVFHLPYTLRDYQSTYMWSTSAIFITQSIGVVVGSIAPIFRCFTVSSSKLFTKWNRIHLVVFKVEKYWIDKLCDWKESRISFLSSGRRSRALIHNLKNLVLSLCIGFQKIIVVSSKMIGLLPTVVLIFGVYCSYCWKSSKAMLFNTPTASRSNDINKDLKNYFLKLDDKMELAEKTLKGISSSMNCLIQKAEKEQHNNLLKLLEHSTGFEGVKNFDMNEVQPLLSVEPLNSWSLAVVTLTCIAIALPNIRKNIVDSLFKGVGEGLLYTHLVEESLKSKSEYVQIQRATMTLWHEVEDNCKWLENTLEIRLYKGKTSVEILKWFADKAEEIVKEIKTSTNGELVENFPNKLIAANSMYRIARSILLNHQSNIEAISEEQLFAILSCMIADILAACLTNIPRVITMKCHENAIEKREASVHVATRLLGRTSEIIKRLEVCELPPSLDDDKMAFIDEWRVHLMQSIP